MKSDEKKFHRTTIRLKDYDYSKPGAYFIIICVYDRQCCFGTIEKTKINLSLVAKIAKEFWQEIPQHFDFIYLD